MTEVPGVVRRTSRRKNSFAVCREPSMAIVEQWKMEVAWYLELRGEKN